MKDCFKNVMIADDSGTARMIIRKCLEIAGLTESKFLEAKNGEEVLLTLKKEKIGLLVTDLNMPVLDGKALLERVKADPALAGVPVIVITSGNNPAREKELKGLGAASVLNKPVSPAAVARACDVCKNIILEVKP